MTTVSQTEGPQPDDATLIRYLVGRASDDDTEQLDERSVVDDDFAERLRAVEHDLVDAYVDGALTGETLDGFRQQYLRSPAGVAQVEFAQALRGAAAASPAAGAVDASPKTSPPQVVAGARAIPWWQLAAAGLLLAAAGSLAVDNFKLRQQMSAADQARVELEQRTKQLQDEVGRQRSTTSAAEEELARARDALAATQAQPNDVRPGAPRILALVLHAATRDAAEIPQLAIPAGVVSVVLRLPLVAVEFPFYEAELRDAANDRVVWRSGRLAAPAASERPQLSVTVPVAVLAPRTYVMALSGISTAGAVEPLDTYPFRVVP